MNNRLGPRLLPGEARVVMGALILILMLSCGCSKEKISKAIEEAKTKTQSLTESAVKAVEEQLPESGSMQLQMNPLAGEVKQAEVEVISIGDGRPNVVQIVSYDQASATRTYPAVMLHGATSASSASALVGQTVPCDMYYQASADDAIAMTPPGASIDVTFGQRNANDNVLTATLGSAKLVASDDSNVQVRGGDVVAVIRGE